MYYSMKPGARLARWLAENRMREDQKRTSEAMLRAMATGTPRLLPPGSFEEFGDPLQEAPPRSLEIGTPQMISASARDFYSATVPEQQQANTPDSQQDYWNLNSEEFHRRQAARRKGVERLCLDGDCSTAYIPLFPDKTGDDFGNIYITFENDEKGKPTTHRPINAVTADTIVQAVRDAGLQHVNINSTYRKPVPGKASRHFSAEAVDINRINGMRVDDPANTANVAALQAALDRQLHIRENFGPNRNEKSEITSKGFAVKADLSGNPKIVKRHRNHIHVSTHEQRPKSPPPAPRLKPRRTP